MTPAGLPHSEISGSTRVNRSPKLIAACRVLHRLPMPRHSPLALSSLSIKPDKTCASSSMAVEDKLSYCNPQGPVGVFDKHPVRWPLLCGRCTPTPGGFGLLFYLIVKDHRESHARYTSRPYVLMIWFTACSFFKPTHQSVQPTRGSTPVF